MACLKSVVGLKHKILGLGKRVSGAKTDGPILTIFASYDVLFWEYR